LRRNEPSAPTCPTNCVHPSQLCVCTEIALASANVHPVDTIVEALGSVDRLERTVEDLIELGRDKASARPDTELVDVLFDVERNWGPTLAEQGRRLIVRRPVADADLQVPGAALRQIPDRRFVAPERDRSELVAALVAGLKEPRLSRFEHPVPDVAEGCEVGSGESPDELLAHHFVVRRSCFP
jgi:hypothetical protein